MDSKKIWKFVPYVATFIIADKLAYILRTAQGNDAADSLGALNLENLLGFPPISLHILDILWGIGACGCLFLYIWYKDSTRKKLRPGEEYGNARFGTPEDIKPFINPKFRENCILSKTEFLTMEDRVKPWYMGRNKNAVFYGGSGAGKTFGVLMPNLLQMHSSYVVIDPKGTLIKSCGWFIQKMGYKFKVFNTINFDASMCYNPFAYIKNEVDIVKLVTCLMDNTKEPDEKGQDPFWPKAERLLYTAIIAYIMEVEVKDERNMLRMIDMIDAIKVTDPMTVKKTRNNEDGDKEEVNEAVEAPCAIDLMFQDHEVKHGQTFAVRQYKKFLKGAGKTKRNILASVGARLSPFDMDTLRDKMHMDELEFDKLGDEKTVMFFIIDDSDTTFNFLVSMALSQMLDVLKRRAFNCGGRLRIPVRVLWDETYNTGQIPKLEKMIAQLRSRGISLWMFFQAKNQLIDLYGEKKAENIEANCDVKGFLGGNEFTTWKDWSELLGQETIDVLDQSESYGMTRSSGTSYKKAGKKLKSIDDIGNMSGDKCLIKLRGVPAFYSEKYDCAKHPLYKYTSDADPKYSFNVRRYIENFRDEYLNQMFDDYTLDAS